MIHPELNMDTQPPEPKKTFAEKLGTAIAIIISIALAALAIQLERSINRRPFMPDEAERLAMRLHEQVGDCPIAHESGKAMDDSEREWWVNLAASAWTLIDGTEETE